MEDGLSNDYVITNKDVIVDYIPSSNVISYSYTIKKDNVVGDTTYISDNSNLNLTLSNDGTYDIEITNVLNDNTTNIVTYKYVIDKTAPIINIKEKTYTIKTSDEFILDVTSYDSYDGNISVTTNMNELNFKETGIKKVYISSTDRAGNTSSDVIYVTVKKDNTNVLILGQLGIFVAIICTIVFLYKYFRSIILERRFSKFTINSQKNKSISLLDSIYNKYDLFIDKYSKLLNNFNIIKKRSERYSKYFKNGEADNLKFVMRKIVLGFIYVLALAILYLFKSKIIEPINMIIPFILGYYTLDIIYYYRYLVYRKQIKSDMLNAISVMNNAFKSGRSIKQAIDMVAIELDGAISDEFKKVSKDLEFGLDMDTAFKRFRDRINLDEAVYLSASISVVNKTGGNIIKVFDSIEKTLYSKKKLNEELNALTSSSKFVMYVLMIVPLLFILLICTVNKGYFDGMFTNPIGILISIIALVLYIIYIVVVRKTMKIRG